jgi:F0F1-type ATP synthase assembly protein I
MSRLRDDIVVHNERVKLFSGFLNAVGLGLIGFAVLRPLTAEISVLTLSTGWWGMIGLVLHGMAHYILGMMRKAETQ